MNTDEKLMLLESKLQKLGRVLVAFSGGVDSTFLLAVAYKVLKENALAVTECSEVLPTVDQQDSAEFCRVRGITHLRLNVDILSNDSYTQNTPDRCYICKKTLYTNLLKLAAEYNAVLIEGSNKDDLNDYRPGMKALRELGVSSPLKEAGLTKDEIRMLSRQMNLPTWSKPASACLSSRFAYGEKITATKLAAVDAAEQILKKNGFEQFRVRVHGNLARIEVLPEQVALAAQEPLRSVICSQFKAIGFTYVTLDLFGYRTGSMNEILKKH